MTVERYELVSSGMYDSTYHCNRCEEDFIVQADNLDLDTCEKADPCNIVAG